MPPTVRRFKEDQPVEASGAFVVDLNGPEEFDPALFDDFANSLKNASNSLSLFDLKWIVRSSGLIIFRKEFAHSVVNYSLETGGYPGPLQSAGHLEIFDASRGRQRRLYSSSFTLADAGILSTKESNRFKLQVLKPALSPHIKVD